jgi:hypothetical protein
MVRGDKERSLITSLRSSLLHLQRRAYHSKLVGSRTALTVFKNWGRSERDRAVPCRNAKTHHH